MRERFNPTRRAILAGMASALASHGARAQSAPPLWRAAAHGGITFGAAGGPEALQDAVCGARHAEHSRLFVHENACKLNVIRNQEGGTNYAPAETLLHFAEKNGMLSQATALVWNDDIPKWLSGKNAAEITRLLDAHLEGFCARFYGRFHSYGLVNEPLYPPHRKPGGLREGPFLAAMGEDYIFRAFQRAAKVDPTTKLFLNEAWCEHDNALGIATRAGLLTLIDKMLDKGLKLDAVGLESHIDSAEPWNPESYARFLEALSRRKLKIWLTEFDVNDHRFSSEPARRDAQVASLTSDFMRVALANRDVEVFITWGMCDRYSWYREPAVAAQRLRGFPARPLPFDDEGREKPITAAMRAAFLAAPTRA